MTVSTPLPDGAPRNFTELLAPISTFLHCQTPQGWLDVAARPEHQETLLVDHCNCELKAAQTGLLIMRRYALDESDLPKVADWTKPYEDFVYHKRGNGQFPDKKERLSIPLKAKADNPLAERIIDRMVALIKEELLHFEQVLSLLMSRQLDYAPVSASRYAKGLVTHVRTYEPAALIDKLIIGAYIEARSCERFARLAPLLDEELRGFYYRLLKSEARHYQDYLALAHSVAEQFSVAPSEIADRVRWFGQVEAELIQSADSELRFHSGVPSSN